ncbi:hypothetical protein AB0L57_32040 [Nocardia sp. NPDC052254]|uniref:hypothetical protein n=1 Tax=Nocardia sp. NPDC052254 TaxID=3155681 RepID=UPI00342A3A3D
MTKSADRGAPSVSDSVAIVGADNPIGSAIDRVCRERSVAVVGRVTRRGWVIDGPPRVVIDVGPAEQVWDSAEFCQQWGSALLYCAPEPHRSGLRRLRELSATVAVGIVATPGDRWPAQVVAPRLLDLAGELADVTPGWYSIDGPFGAVPGADRP